ncbi:MAG: class I SAM-dependent methyltransferase [Methanomassiliicoccales archaeon]|nr:class I SAM-dependent methyltransferase [Methanomassiliicoccales archaeon]
MRTPKKEKSSFARSATSAEEREPLDEYEQSAKYYDVWYEDFTEDVGFYQGLAERTGGPVLECMCGTGRIMIPLADAGFELTGVDRSSAMLDILTAKLDLIGGRVERNIDIIQGDVRTFKTSRRFRLAVVPFNSFLHLLTRKEQEETLKNIWGHLEKGGLLSISVFNPRLDRPEGLMRHRGTKITSKGEVISKFEAQSFDTTNQTTTVHYFYDISRQDKEFRRVTTSMRLRLLFYQEAVEMLQNAGFDVIETYGDYALSPFRKNSELMAFVARKL